MITKIIEIVNRPQIEIVNCPKNLYSSGQGIISLILIPILVLQQGLYYLRVELTLKQLSTPTQRSMFLFLTNNCPPLRH